MIPLIKAPPLTPGRWAPCLGILLALNGTMGCSPSPGRLGDPIIAPGSGENLTEQGPYWVSRKEIAAPARFDDAISTVLFYPSDNGGVMATGGPFPPVIVVQEQGIPRESFEWIGSALASWGFIVGIPAHPWERPDYAIDNADWALDAILDQGRDDGSILWGAVNEDSPGLIRFNIPASEAAWLDLNPGFVSRAHLGAELQTANVAAIPGAMLLVDGAKDCVADPILGWDDYAIERYQTTISGLSHSLFSNPSSGDCLDAADCDSTLCSPEITLATGRSLVSAVTVAFHRAILRGDTFEPSLEDTLGGLDGVTSEALYP